MDKNFKITTEKINKKEILEKIKIYNNEIIDLSDLNIFEAAKTIIMISTYGTYKNSTKKFKCKVSTPNIQNLLNDIPLNGAIELV